ncbi:MAG: hypothetical protein ACODAJ_07660 [Planctomycetota bacterium]
MSKRRWTVALAALWACGTVAAAAGGVPAMVKRVTDRASFALYVPRDWRATESAHQGYRILVVSDPQGRSGVSMCLGRSPRGGDLTALARHLLDGIARSCPKLRLGEAHVSGDRRRLVFDGVYGGPGDGMREFRSWLSLDGREFVYSSIGAPQGQLAARKSLLLTILANIRVLKGAFQYKGGGQRPELVRRPPGDIRSTLQRAHGAGGDALVDAGRTRSLHQEQRWVVQMEGGTLQGVAPGTTRTPKLLRPAPGAPLRTVRLPGRPVRYGQEMRPLDPSKLWRPGSGR